MNDLKDRVYVTMWHSFAERPLDLGVLYDSVEAVQQEIESEGYFCRIAKLGGRTYEAQVTRKRKR